MKICKKRCEEKITGFPDVKGGEVVYKKNNSVISTDESEDYYFVGPDNGIFQYVMQSDISEIYTIDPVSIYKNEKGATFHARDIFAPIAARLAIGERAENIGKRMDIRACQ